MEPWAPPFEFGVTEHLAVCSQQIEGDREMSRFFTPAFLVSALHPCNLWGKGDEHILGPIRGYDQQTPHLSTHHSVNDSSIKRADFSKTIKRNSLINFYC